jgi:hypothetical protein
MASLHIEYDGQDQGNEKRGKFWPAVGNAFGGNSAAPGKSSAAGRS